VGVPGLPPAPIPKADYPAYNKKRSAEDMFWFIDYTTRGRSAMIREDGWKYCFYNGDMEELYHYSEDPLELKNLAAEPAHQERKAAMKKKLFDQGFVGIK
jgi:arylsulfatase A-like enzyme